MIYTTVLCLPFLMVSAQVAQTESCYALVRKLNSPRADERQLLEERLLQHSGGLYAVVRGSRHIDPDITSACLRILDEWHWKSRLASMVRDVEGDFDRFVNALLYAPSADLEAFIKASEHGRTLDRYFLRAARAAKSKHVVSLRKIPLTSRRPSITSLGTWKRSRRYASTDICGPFSARTLVTLPDARAPRKRMASHIPSFSARRRRP